MSTDNPPDTQFLFSGRLFKPQYPKVEDIDIEDIAHGLSNLCRYSGQCRTFYSVAEHATLMTFYALRNYDISKQDALAILLHDATEAYINDVSKAIKHLLPNYIWLENRIESVIAERFQVDFSLPLIKELDERILKQEIVNFFNLRDPDFQEHEGLHFLLDIDPLPVALFGWEPGKAKKRFYDYATDLTA